MIIRQKQKIIQVRQEHCKGFSHTEEKNYHYGVLSVDSCIGERTDH